MGEVFNIVFFFNNYVLIITTYFVLKYFLAVSYTRFKFLENKIAFQKRLNAEIIKNNRICDKDLYTYDS